MSEPRNLAYERVFLREAVQEAERRYGVTTNSFVSRVFQRLAKGAEEYGEGAYLENDLMRELREEAWDAAAYAVLEAQKLLAANDELTDSRAYHLHEIAQLAIVLDWHAQQVMLAE